MAKPRKKPPLRTVQISCNKCRACGQEFARETMIRGTPAYKLIGGKVMVK